MLIQPIDYFLLVWFALAAASTLYVGIDQYRNNPEPIVMKWGFILVTLYMGPLGLLLYVMADKEPRPGEHEEFVKPLWKQGGESTKRKLPNMRLASRSASGASPTSPSDTKRSAPGCNAKSRSKTLRSTRLLRPIEPLNRPRSSATLRPCLTWMSCQRDFPRHSEWRLLPNRSSLS